MVPPHCHRLCFSNLPARNTKCGFDVKPGNSDGNRAAVENRREIKLKTDCGIHGAVTANSLGATRTKRPFRVTKSNSNLSALQRIAKEEIYTSNYGNNQFAEEDEKEEEKGKEVGILNE